MVARHILRSTGRKGFFDGRKEFGLPITETLDVKVQGTGKLDPSFKSALGLQGAFAAERVWHTWKLTVDPDDAKRLDFNISGTYKLLPDCAQKAPDVREYLSSTIPGWARRLCQARLLFILVRTSEDRLWRG
ncbi:hypothetical protein CALCODRAFT_503284 [Calocera cornea HHB12733]|uniref:Uncharacterized protein n=1 Tax=Calocera cornea HHB12733 TaxID=1353952 RepID=A0A165CXU9_9BASI|nr:hypothetical protein CALCODRAFT_503284 [Calocera cornea HHB12733]